MTHDGDRPQVLEKLGRFQLVTKLYTTAVGSVWSATRVGDPDGSKFIAKLFDPVEGFGDIAESLQSFLQSAETLSAVASVRDSHWAAVHELGELGGRAFFITDYYPRTAQRLIAGRVKLDAAGLFRIADSVVCGLKELRSACGRDHGNLKPSNILIDAASALRRAKVVLIDPAPHPSPSPDSEGRDLKALGEVLYELATRRPLQRRGGWPVPLLPEWKELGSKGKGWHKLCNQLLYPVDDHEDKRLDAVGKALAAL